MNLKKHIEEIIGTLLGGSAGMISQSVYDDWIRPILVSAICAVIGLLITHFGKQILKKLKL